MKKRIAITGWCHDRIKSLVKNPVLSIDATAGTGRDTIFLCELAGRTGRVIALDIQPQAVEQTKKRLIENKMEERAAVFLDSHEHIDRYAEPETVSLIMFNLGYLPGGDHRLATKGPTTIRALEKGLKLLHGGGVVSLLIYSGGDSGFEEKNQVLAWIKTLPPDQYTVILESFYNKPNHPPLPVYIIKNE